MSEIVDKAVSVLMNVPKAERDRIIVRETVHQAGDRNEQDRPVFSFRAGLRHRTVEAQTRDEEIARFRTGALEQYQSLFS